jgi:hypothetical protein
MNENANVSGFLGRGNGSRIIGKVARDDPTRGCWQHVEPGGSQDDMGRPGRQSRALFVRSGIPTIGELTFTGDGLYSGCQIAVGVPICSERDQRRAD